MPRNPLDTRLPAIWHRLDAAGVLAGILAVLDSGFDRVHGFIGQLFDLRSIDRIPDRHLPLKGPQVGYDWRADKSHAENRRRTRYAVRTHSQKGSQDRLADILRAFGIIAGTEAGCYRIVDMASKLVQTAAAPWGASAFVAADYWHDGAYVLEVPDGPFIPELREEMAATTPSSERWYLRIISESVIEPDETSAGTFGSGTVVYLPEIHGPLMFGLGKTLPWPDEETPPTPQETDIDIVEPFLFVRARRNRLCKEVFTAPAEGAGVTVDGRYFEYTDGLAAYDEDSTWIYLEAVVDRWIDMPPGTFRQAGIFMGLQHSSVHADPAWLLPAQVTDHGSMGCMQNFTAKEIQGRDQRLFRWAIKLR